MNSHYKVALFAALVAMAAVPFGVATFANADGEAEQETNDRRIVVGIMDTSIGPDSTVTCIVPFSECIELTAGGQGTKSVMVSSRDEVELRIEGSVNVSGDSLATDPVTENIVPGGLGQQEISLCYAYTGVSPEQILLIKSGECSFQ